MKSKILVLFALMLSITCYSQKSVTTYVFVAEECPVCNYIGKTLKKISDEYTEKVNFVAVFPQKMSSYKTASLFKKKYGLVNFSIELDHDLMIANRFNASVTPEVVVVSDKNIILYQGRVNNSYAAPGRMRHGKVTEDLEIALQKILQGNPIPKPWPNPVGCYITKKHG